MSIMACESFDSRKHQVYLICRGADRGNQRYIAPRDLVARNRCVVVSICLSPTLPDLYRSPLIQKEKHFILAKAAQGGQQQLHLFVVTGIWACEHPSGLSPSVTSAPQDSGKSASGNDVTV